MKHKITLLLCVLLFVGGCACKPTDPEELKIYEENNDPLEPMNRAIFGFNTAANEYVLNPVAKGYRAITNQPVRDGVSNFISNLEQPLFFIQTALEADGEGAWNIFKRFTINSTLGFFGIFDAASELGIPHVKRSMGDTLAVWGFKDGGPYLVLPLLGPSNVRDATGLTSAFLGDPIDLVYREWWFKITRYTVAGITLYESKMDFINNLYQTSTDPYATMRSMWQQNRKKEVDRLTGTEETTTKQDYEFDFPEEES